MKSFFHTEKVSPRASVALLLLRVVAGLAFMQHGWIKMQNPTGWMGSSSTVPAFFQVLAAISEFGGGLAWILGLLTPIGSFGILCTMTVAVYTHLSKGQPFVGRGGSYELALVYFSIALVMIWIGPGKYSLDAKYLSKKGK